MLEQLKNEGDRRGSNPIPIVFSSTCATYGNLAKGTPIHEECAQNPINPYGKSKLIVEEIIKDFAKAYNMPSVILRYFNAAGADSSGNLGEDHDPETHLIPLVLDACLGLRPDIKIFGDDYETSDGTCVRDYIHVNDLANAHILAVKKLIAYGGNYIFNLGNEIGYSVKEVIDSASRVTGVMPKTIIFPRRKGDPPVLVASAKKAIAELQWHKTYSSIDEIIESAWNWHKNKFHQSF